MHSSSAIGPDMINKKETMTSIVALRNSANEISNQVTDGDSFQTPSYGLDLIMKQD